jgi:hypothetical protein
MPESYTKYYLSKTKNLLVGKAFFLVFFLHISWVSGQTFRFQRDASVPALLGSDTLTNAWAGGLNAAQYSTVQLNNDAIDDLVVYDRTTNKVSTFVAEKTGNSFRWKHAPVYETQFPSITNWMLLVDYNFDGKKDIFTYTTFGVKVYRNASVNGKLVWEVASELLLSESSSGEFNLSVLSTDIPAILDVDNDGDVDILSGDAIGHVLYWYQNQSMERNGNPNELKFKTASRCWGGFEGSETCGQYQLGVSCIEDNSGRSSRIQHAGSTALALDFNSDGIKDLLFTGVSCTSLTRLTNNGTLSRAQMNSYSSPFPTEKPISFLFPAAFYEDINFDGKKDLIATPNVSANEGNLLDFSKSNWLYTNNGQTNQPVFTFAADNFLQNTMIDLGELTFPALADYDGDQDLDLFVGNAGMPYAGGLLGTLALYENIGTKSQAVFRLKTNDYLNLSALDASYLKPFFMDWNRDGAVDLMLMNTSSQGTALKVFANSAPAGQAFQFPAQASQTVTIPNLRSEFTPGFYDFDGDNDWDMLLGKSLDGLEYYQNTGSNATPVFRLQKQAFAGTPLNVFDRNYAPLITDWNNDGKPDLLCTYRNLAEEPYGGRVLVFSGITANPSDSLKAQSNTILDEARNAYAAVSLPSYVTPAAGDLNADGLPDLVLGTSGGGVILLKNSSLKDDTAAADGIRLGPNPATEGWLYLTTDTDSQVSFYNLLGKQMLETKTTQANVQLPVQVGSWAAGMYVVKVRNAGGTRVKKFMVWP